MKTKTLLSILLISVLAFNIKSLNATEAAAICAKLCFGHHRFTPVKIEVIAGRPLVLTVVNSGDERIEFESFKLHREKVIEAGQTVVLHLPPLRPGSYDFFDDFHQDVPAGEIVVR